MNYDQIPLTKLIGSIYRSTQAYMNEVTKQYQLGCGTYPYLMTLFHNDGINQNQISKELDVDKSMSARAIKKLIELGYVKKESDPEDSRAYKLYLTEQGKEIVPTLKTEINNWNQIITANLDNKDKDELIHLLRIILHDTKKHRLDQKVEG